MFDKLFDCLDREVDDEIEFADEDGSVDRLVKKVLFRNSLCDLVFKMLTLKLFARFTFRIDLFSFKKSLFLVIFLAR